MTTAATRGRSSQRRGSQWEQVIDAYHDHLRAAGKAWLVQVPTEARVMGPTGMDARGRTTFPATWAARASVDFVGVVAGGRAVAVEAKTCTTERWWFSEALGGPTSGKPAGVEWETLDAVDQLGGLALVLLDWRGSQWCVEFGVLRLWREAGKASVTETELAPRARLLRGAQWLSS